MPSTRHVSKNHPSPTSPTPKSGNTIPANTHLLVTTASHIFAWDKAGIHTIFKSSKNSIVAAREAKDGSGILAVADKHVVVLHDTKRGQERSWGLEADEDQVRHLEYTADAKSLFLSTNLMPDIQRYSTERSRLLSPTQAHASPPVALAVSSTGHLMVSASDNPPVVYLKDLTHNSPPTLIESRASETAVSVIAFHPERPNIFLLAFKDSTLAAFDATKIGRKQAGSLSNQITVNNAEISHLEKLHRTTSGTHHATSIVDAAFLPGYKTRAISVGSDGRCRLLDFADGGMVLRTWHAKAPVTSVAVFSRKAGTETGNQRSSARGNHTIGGPTSTNNLIAVGRADGVVHLYDSVGLLLDQKALSDGGERIISVEWAKGTSPKPISDTKLAREVEMVPPVEGSKVGGKASNSTPPATQARRGTTFQHIGLPPELRKPAGQPETGALRRFTVHPDEVEEDTVRHTPLQGSHNRSALSKGQYLDLFSPVKPPETHTEETPKMRVASPPRSRPKISSQTFVRSPDATSASARGTVSKPRNLALFPSTDSGEQAPAETSQPKQSVQTASPAPKKQITFKPSSQRRVRKSNTFRASNTAPNNNNAKVLADLRKMNVSQQTGGTLSAFSGASQQRAKQGSTRKENAFGLFHRRQNHVETELNSDTALKTYEHVHHKQHWPEDSNQHSSLEGDIWLTSDSETQQQQRRRRRRQGGDGGGERPPARQTSRSRIDSRGSTTASRKPAPLSLAAKHHQLVDGSTDDEEMFTAGTHVSPSGAFSPSSNDVRQLFPRSSSLSPRKGKKKSPPKKRLQHSQERTLRELASNTAMGRPSSLSKSPWARARATKAAPLRDDGVYVLEDTTMERQQQSDGAQQIVGHCSVCGPTKLRVQDLEGDVARLKGEILVLKAAMRRSGVPLPASLRQR